MSPWWLTADTVITFAVGLATMAFAGWIYSLAPKAAAHRALAAFLFIDAISVPFTSLADAAVGVVEHAIQALGPSPSPASVQGVAIEHADMLQLASALIQTAAVSISVTGFFLVWFTVSYPRQRSAGAWRRSLLLMTAILAVAGAAWLLVDPYAFRITDGGQIYSTSQASANWPNLAAVWLGLANVTAWLLARDARRAGTHDEARSLRLVSLGFLLYPIARSLRGLFFAMDVWRGEIPSQAGLAESELTVAALGVFGLAATVLLARRPDGHVAWGALAAIGLSLAAGVAIQLDWLPRASTVTIQAATLPVLITYGIVRHHTFGVDLKVQWTVSRSTVAAAFVGAFFAASEFAQLFFGETLRSQYMGIAAAGLLVMAIAPIQRAADRLAQKAVPSPTGVPAIEAAYLAGLRAAARDGRITRREERHLADMAEHLKIGPKRALELREGMETEVKP